MWPNFDDKQVVVILTRDACNMLMTRKENAIYVRIAFLYIERAASCKDCPPRLDILITCICGWRQAEVDQISYLGTLVSAWLLFVDAIYTANTE